MPLLLVGLAACQRPEEPARPATLLPKDQMVGLLVGLHLLEARVDASRLSPDSARALFLAQQRDLFWRAQTTDSVFQRSYRYYSVHGKDLDELYQTVIDSLGRQERQLGGNPSQDTPEETARRARTGQSFMTR